MITVFSFGLGQESLSLLHRLGTDTGFYVKHVQGRLLIVGSDTGNEHDHTYSILPMVKEFCAKHKFNFTWVTPDMGFHPKTWQSLTYQYKKNSSIGSAAFRQSCTDNLKVKVVDNFVEYWLHKKYVYLSRKRVYKWYADRYGGFRLMLGFARGEETRTSNGDKFDPVWKKQVYTRHYPLILENMDRQACIDYNTTHWQEKVWPSNCKFCFYQSDQEILWLYRNDPLGFAEWVEMEKVKLTKYAHVTKNYGVYGKISLTQKLDKAQKLYGHWSDEQLNEYKFSHGHCIKSKY